MLNRHSRLDHPFSAHFITTVTLERGRWFTNDKECGALLECFEFARAKHGVLCVGYVLMPDHLHALLYQQEENLSVAKMMESFKKFSSRNLRPCSYSGQTLWREHYDDVPLPGPKAAVRRLYYMHFNPVKAGLVERPELYLWSSARFYSLEKMSVITITPLSA